MLQQIQLQHRPSVQLLTVSCMPCRESSSCNGSARNCSTGLRTTPSLCCFLRCCCVQAMAKMQFGADPAPIPCSAFNHDGTIYAYALSYDWSRGFQVRQGPWLGVHQDLAAAFWLAVSLQAGLDSAGGVPWTMLQYSSSKAATAAAVVQHAGWLVVVVQAQHSIALWSLQCWHLCVRADINPEKQVVGMQQGSSANWCRTAEAPLVLDVVLGQACGASASLDCCVMLRCVLPHCCCRPTTRRTCPTASTCMPHRIQRWVAGTAGLLWQTCSAQ